MPFTAAQISNITNAALDYYIRGEALDQSIQDKPMLNALMKRTKTFPGGKENISIPLKGGRGTDRGVVLQGYEHDDTVGYTNPSNIKRVVYPWKEIHSGIQFTGTELKKDGISVVDSTTGKNTTEHSERELTALTGILDDKLDSMAQGWSELFNEMLWKDGTQDSKLIPGVQALITATPTVGTTGGLDRGLASYWRNRALVGASKIVSSTANQTLTKTLRSEVRQLHRFGGKPSLVLCGSTVLDKLEAEVAEKGIYSQQGFSNAGKNDIGMAMISMRGVGDFTYDPTLDDLGLADYLYLIDPSHLVLRVMEGEDKKTHTPARPYNQYTYYRAMTWTGGLTIDQLNCHGVYQVS
jgi:hypothetical protein